MKKILWLALALLIMAQASAQDVGNIEVKERIARSKGIFIGGGISYTFGKNIGDYKQGINFEAGYLKRLNRVLSIGPSFSYHKFDYDPAETGLNNIFIGGPYNDGGADYYQGLYFDFKGGDVTLASLAFNLKLNFVPVTDVSKISIYGYAKPFISSVKRTKVAGDGILLRNSGNLNDANDWLLEDFFPWDPDDDQYLIDFYGIDVSDDLREESAITGGIFIGPGIEFMPAKSVSIYVQALFGYTFPISIVSTESYQGSGDLDEFINSGQDFQKFPVIKQGFPSLNIQAGLSFNF
jgi:hypothetical protein